MQVEKWGNSLAVRLPKAVVEALGLKAGDDVDIVAATRRRIEIDKNDRRKRAIARMRARQWSVPEGYRFDRDAANER